MKFDPTFDYTTAWTQEGENNVFWKFGELIKLLIILSSDAVKQREIMGAGALADEMAEDFNSYFTLCRNEYILMNLLDIDQLSPLDKLDGFLDERSGENSVDFWDDSKLSSNPDWDIVRRIAKEVLKLLNMTDLIITFERVEKYELSLIGKKLMVQSTKTRIIRNN